MLVDIFNSFEPTQFLIDSPLWVSFIAPGVAFTVTLGVIYTLSRLTIHNKDAREGIVGAIGFILFVCGGIWVALVLTDVFKHAGVNVGYPLVLAVTVGAISNILVVVIIAYAAFAAHRFFQALQSPKS